MRIWNAKNKIAFCGQKEKICKTWTEKKIICKATILNPPFYTSAIITENGKTTSKIAQGFLKCWITRCLTIIRPKFWTEFYLRRSSVNYVSFLLVVNNLHCLWNLKFADYFYTFYNLQIGLLFIQAITQLSRAAEITVFTHLFMHIYNV